MKTTLNYLGLNLEVVYNVIPEQKGTSETEPIPNDVCATEVYHNGEDIYNLIGYDILMGMEAKLRHSIFKN